LKSFRGRKLKRGILLHGKPGTGKTLTAMYLATQMKERTVILLTGRGQGLIENSCFFARWLAPSMVIIEDVDLIGEERSTPEVLEPALASRPGRVDQAFEVPLPDADCRRSLFELYSKGMTVQVNDMEGYVKRTAGASGAFIGELMRKAALFAAADSTPIVVTDAHLDEAMHEMIVEAALREVCWVQETLASPAYKKVSPTKVRAFISSDVQ
jgi:ATP-dependent 26S proteasome regulatory subunit